MPDYSQTKIYIIRSRNTDRVYVGATTSTLVKRFSNHNCRFAKGKSQTRAYKVLEHGDCYIELLERYPCLDKDESNAREKYWMRQFDEQKVNRNIPGRTSAQYRQDNRERYNERSRQYRINNPEYLKEYRQNNRQILYEKRNKKYECSCGGRYIHKNRARHMGSKMHKKWIFNQWSEFNHL